MIRCPLRAAAVAFALLVVPVAAHAEPPPPRNWDLAILGYGWLIAGEASFDTEFGVFEADRGIRDNLEDLDLAAMAAANFRYRRFMAFVDGIWTQLGDDSSVVNGRVDGDGTLAYLDGKLGVRLLDRAAPWADASRDASPRVLFDLLVGARVQAGILPTLNASVIGDVGGFDVGDSSELTWMIMPTVNWRLSRRWGFHAGYKLVKAERQRPSTNRDLDYELNGPAAGVGFHF